MRAIYQIPYQTHHRHHTMKTSMVLLALATAALAAPAQHEEAFENDHHVPTKFLDTFTRERKSTLESSSSLSPGSPVNLPSTPQVSEFGVSARSFNLKKPIIIKKKVGSSYRVYRDSDEEKLDSPEPCRKQVRVNLCDDHSVAKSADMMSSPTINDPSIQMIEDDMKQSIVLAKEAVENLQKDFKEVEQKPAKSAPWKHGGSDSDVELHQDIEDARQALEHIHNNFGILESPNTHSTNEKEAENVEDLVFPLAQTEEERMAQWKEAIENIHRNVEIVRNIEDSFKLAHDDISHTDEVTPSIKEINKHDLHKHSTKEDLRVAENLKKEHKQTIEQLEHSKLEKSNEMKSDIMEKDMLESASMVSASKLQELNQFDKSRHTPEQKLKNHQIAKNTVQKLHGGKHAAEMNLEHLPQNIDTLSLKLAEEVKERKTETEDSENKDKFEDLSTKKMIENERNAEKELHSTHKPLKHDEHAKHFKETEHIEMKADERFTGKHSEAVENKDETQQGHHITKQMKQASSFANEGLVPSDIEKHAEIKKHEHMVHKDHSFVEGKMVQNDNSMVSASDFLSRDQHKGQTFDMKAAEDTKNMHHQLINQPHMRWAQDLNTEMGVMKSVPETHQAMDHTKPMHSGHHHAQQHASHHHLDTSSHGHLRHHDHFMTHGKSADMDNAMQSYFMSMRDTDNLGQEGHRFRWRPSHTHESARTAYGAPAPSPPASGAVGLFPNANVGGCGIPLLLSCNPSVVSGSLAKAHPTSYAAPAYRTEDDFNFHSKRDVKKTGNLVNTLNRTPSNPIMETTNVLVAKH